MEKSFKKTSFVHNKNERRFFMENKTYQEVPFIITGKDLDYLSDMFGIIMH